MLLLTAKPLNLSLNNFNLDSSNGLTSAKQLVLGFSSHMASDPELKKSGSKGSSPLCLVLPPLLMCHLQVDQTKLATLCAVSVTQKVSSSDPLHLFCMQLKPSQVSRLPEAPEPLYWFVSGFLGWFFVLFFFLFSNIFPYSFKFPFYGAIIYFSSHMYRAPAFFVVRLLWIYISWVLIALSAVSVKASLRYRSELSLERRRPMLGGTTFDLLPVENEPAGTHSSSEQHSTPF